MDNYFEGHKRVMTLVKGVNLLVVFHSCRVEF